MIAIKMNFIAVTHSSCYINMAHITAQKCANYNVEHTLLRYPALYFSLLAPSVVCIVYYKNGSFQFH